MQGGDPMEKAAGRRVVPLPFHREPERRGPETQRTGQGYGRGIDLHDEGDISKNMKAFVEKYRLDSFTLSSDDGLDDRVDVGGWPGRCGELHPVVQERHPVARTRDHNLWDDSPRLNHNRHNEEHPPYTDPCSRGSRKRCEQHPGMEFVVGCRDRI